MNSLTGWSMPPPSQEPRAQNCWDTAYKWLRLAQGLRTVTFDMSYDDGGMCSAGLDFDAVWTEMMEEWQQHQVRLGYLRAALEGFVRLLYPDTAEPGLVVEAAEQRLQQHPTHGLCTRMQSPTICGRMPRTACRALARRWRQR
ncbi:hypothetical protein NKH77_25175 [Streptomyces sp. M19]